MGVSAEGNWVDVGNSSSQYLKWVSKDDGYTEHDFHIKNAKRESLSMIIHEINECEVNDILTKWGIVNNHIIPLRRKSIELLRYNEEVRPSHIISPYGLSGGCVLSRDRARARW